MPPCQVRQRRACLMATPTSADLRRLNLVAATDDVADPPQIDTFPGAAAHGAGEVVLEPAAVVVVVGDVLPPIAAGDDVVNRAVVLDA